MWAIGTRGVRSLLPIPGRPVFGAGLNAYPPDGSDRNTRDCELI